MNDRPATELCVAAATRLAMREGIFASVIRRGDPTVGAIALRLNLLNGTSRVLVETRIGDARAWTPATSTDPMPDKDADAYLSRAADIDPDLWIVEIEDKQGRLWFEGKIESL